MLNVNDILKIVKLILLSGYLKKHKPLSLLLVGEVGIGKTEITTNFKSSRLIMLTDVSKTGVYTAIKQNKALKHIVIPDFIKITQKRRSTSDDLISTLNSAIEEGLTKSYLYHTQDDFKGKNLGLITSTTKASYGQHKTNWENIGFLSRMIICTYSYGKETTEKVFKYIFNEEYLDNNIREILKGYKDVFVHSEPELNKQLEQLSGGKFRTQKQLQTLVKCHAILRGDDRIKQMDIDEIMRLSQYLNFNYKKL